MAPKVHQRGGVKGHRSRESRDLVNHFEKRNKQLLKKFLKRQRKKEGTRTEKNKIIAKAVKVISGREIIKKWADKERHIARRQLERKRIKPFTYYCKLLALDALFSRHLPKGPVELGDKKKKKTYSLRKKTLLTETKKRDIGEKIHEIGATTAKTKKEVSKQMRNLRKTLPKELRKIA